MYFYTHYVFQQSGIPADKVPYATVGTGACECITALTCVSINYIFIASAATANSRIRTLHVTYNNCGSMITGK